ncbi:carbohydrate ABC transporter permease [Paenibacillus sp. BC26]|uniref:carbohydrate ABC transporter permease n=1 Tax=Paenibacillus sp. BC26 TaxID=1881032 RepID=UPI0008DF72F9|nr:sugar ABC transporter permease [Paenibacillus sp. BC26]SFT06629.1 carbohydrate ABC transporter membrane protein 1, CUT1 family [Paenibacillus sp. BC26]
MSEPTRALAETGIRTGRRLHYKTVVTGILFLIPSAVLITFAVFIPTVWNLLLSFQEWDGFLERNWVGFANYKEVFSDELTRSSLYHSVELAVISTLFALLLGVALAAFIFKLGRKEGAVYRLFIFMPTMLPLAIIGLLFAFVYNPEMGLINQFLRLVGGDSLTQAWLENRHTVMASIIVVGIWRIAGLTMMLCFAAMQGIPSSLFESSRLDGAGYGRQFFSIVLPLIRPIVQLSAVFTLVMQFKTYDLVFIMTGGGPGTISKTIPLQMIDTAFNYNEYGLSAAMGFTLTIVVAVFIWITNRLLGGQSYEY